MIARSTTTFAELRHLLLDLGFLVSKRGKFWVFEHRPSKTTLAYRPYKARERVTKIDLHITRQDLDWHGIMTEQEFDDLLRKATA